jgi:hypothetical protein
MIDIDWKDRAIERRYENKRLKKRIKELTLSRDTWREKAIERKEGITQLKQQVQLIKKNIQKIIEV